MAITLITTAGQQAIAEAIANNSTLKIASIAVGDGGGATYTPTVSQTALKGQKWSGELNRKEINPENEKQIIFEGRIASGVGGFYIREVGLFDENNVLIAVSDFPESFKAAADQYELYIRMIVEFANTDITNIIVKQDMVYATKEYVDNAVKSSTAIDDLKKDFTAHKADLASHTYYIGTATGTNSLVATASNITELATALTLRFQNTTTNTGAVTLNFNALGAKSVVNSKGEALEAGDLAAGGIYTVSYNGSNFILQGSGGGVSKALQVTSLTATVGFSVAGQVQLNWTFPTDTKRKGIVIRYKTGDYPTGPTDGTLFYDSNDATPVTTLTKQGFTDGTKYYFRAFTWTYKNATRVYTTDITNAQAFATPLQTKGTQTFTSSGTFVAPAGVTSVQIYAVGGGAGGGGGDSSSGGGGGGGGYTATKTLNVTPGSSYAVVVGSGGQGGSAGNYSGFDGGDSYVQSITYGANGGRAAVTRTEGGNGGSGGGCGAYQSALKNAGNGGSDGSNGGSNSAFNGGTGQGVTTKAWGDPTSTIYSGGGGGGGYFDPAGTTSPKSAKGGLIGGGDGGLDGSFSGKNGTANTGGGGGGGSNAQSSGSSGGNGGSGIVLIRWGY